MTNQTPTIASTDLFIRLFKDAPNWGGIAPAWVTPAERGNLTNLKRSGLLTTFVSDGDPFAEFTDLGKRLGKDLTGHDEMGRTVAQES